MADLGTSVGLQGRYQGDSAQNSPAYIKPTPNTLGDDFIAAMDKQERKKKAEQDAFDKQLSPFISIDGSKYLPHRVPLIQEQSQRILQEAMKAKGKNGNVLFNPDVQKELTKLQELQSKYGREAAYAKEIATKLNGDAKYEYTEDFRKDIGKAIEGTIDPEKYVSSEMADEAQTFYKYGTPKAQTDLFEFMTPQADREVVLKVMQPNGTYKETVTKGSQIYNTKEGQDAQYQKFLEFTTNGQDPHAKYFLKEATNQINKNDNLAYQESFKSLTPLEAQQFVAQEAAKIMLERAMTTNKLKTVDKTTKIPTGAGIEMNFGGGRYKTKSGDYQFDENQKDTTDEQRYDNYVSRNMPTFIANYVKEGKGTEKDAKAYYQSDKGVESLRKGFELYYDKSPNVVGVTVSSTQKQDDLNPSVIVKDSQGKEIEFVPVRYNIDSENNKPTSVYGYKRKKVMNIYGKMVTELEATTIPYNINTKGVNAVAPDLADLYKKQYKKDLDLSVKGETTTKAAPKASAPKIIKSDGSDIDKWGKDSEYQVGNKIYFYDKGTKKWKTK